MTQHKSDCAVHDAPAYTPGPCDCEPGECMFDRCPDCDRLVDGHGMTVDPRGCCFTCKAD